jgi:hypothetical protein
MTAPTTRTHTTSIVLRARVSFQYRQPSSNLSPSTIIRAVSSVIPNRCSCRHGVPEINTVHIPCIVSLRSCSTDIAAATDATTHVIALSSVFVMAISRLLLRSMAAQMMTAVVAPRYLSS